MRCGQLFSCVGCLANRGPLGWFHRKLVPGSNPAVSFGKRRLGGSTPNAQRNSPRTTVHRDGWMTCRKSRPRSTGALAHNEWRVLIWLGLKMNLKNRARGVPTEDGKLIYIVDDETMLLDLARYVLEREGYEVKTYCNPTQALLDYRRVRRKPSMILTDFQMSKMNGLELTAACRQITPSLKVALASGSVGTSAFAHHTEPPDAFLAKPYGKRDLVRMVRSLLD